MNILITTHRFFPDIGGIETISSILGCHFAAAGHSVRLITQSSLQGSSEPHFPFQVIRCPSPLQLLACCRWADVVLQNNIEVRQLWPLLLLRKPCVIGLQTWVRTVDGQRGLLQRFKLMALRRADRLVACSNALKLDANLRSTVIGNPYNDRLFRRRSDVSRRKAIAFLGRLVSDKGADMLIRSFAAVQPTGWTLTLIGDGPETPRLETLATILGVRHSVDFRGALQDEALVEALNQHEILVVPSRWREPFGVVVLEGLACGCVVLASDGGGLPDAVGPAGLLFRRGDQGDLNAKLSQLIADVVLRQQLRACAASHLKAFQQAVVGDHYLSLIQQAYSRNQPC